MLYDFDVEYDRTDRLIKLHDLCVYCLYNVFHTKLDIKLSPTQYGMSYESLESNVILPGAKRKIEWKAGVVLDKMQVIKAALLFGDEVLFDIEELVREHNRHIRMGDIVAVTRLNGDSLCSYHISHEDV